MCGIAGFFNYKSKAPIPEERILSVLESMRYRGPDHLGLFTDGNIAMGNARLSIQGISELGNQPVFNEDKSVVVVYNGEIYNYPELREDLIKRGHSFSTATDTEVLVHLYEEWGDDLAKDLNGMFAFALFDMKKACLILGRDRSAQKPIYINRNRDGIFFSSELKAMLPHLESVTLNLSSVRTFLSLGYTLEPQTILNEVETLEPATLLKLDHRGESLKRYWTPKVDESAIIVNEEAWEQEADLILKKAVRRHLLSDVPVTLMLSSGVDSSLLSLYLKEESKISKAYTGSFIDCKDHDEYDFAAALGRYCGFEVERVELSNQVLADNLEGFLSNASMPQGDYSGLATFCLSKAISNKYRVVIGGDGGDELFGGYPTYTLPFLGRKYSILPKSAIKLAHGLSNIFCNKGKYMSLPFRLQQLFMAWGEEPVRAHFQLKNFLHDTLAAEILSSDLVGYAHSCDAENYFKKFYNMEFLSDPVHKLCWIDFNTFLRSGTIPKIERNSMAWSLEARLPFLDNDVINLGLQTSSRLMLEGTKTKVSLRKLLQNKLRNNIELNPRKQGFSPPLATMLEQGLKSWKEHWLNAGIPLFSDDLPAVLDKWKLKGWDLHRLEWNICTLSDWCSRNKVL